MYVTGLVAFADLAIWMYLLLGRGGFWKTHAIEDGSHTPPATWPDICVVIPARNEADILPDTLPSLLNNDYAGLLRIIIVDDRSEDATSHVATSIAASLNKSDCLTVVQAPALPVGWTGKVRAMQCGLDHIATQPTPPHYVLFTDADIAYDKGMISRLAAKAESGDFSLTSLMVRLRCKSGAERWLIPAFVYFFQLLYPFDWVNNPKRNTAAAAGGCMLARYDMLMKTNGMNSIRTALIDDCALGRVMKQQGPIWLGLTQHVHSLRQYPTLSHIRSMVARNAYDQLGYNVFNLIAAVLGLIITYIAPVVLTICATGATQLMAATSWVVMGVTFYPILRFYGRSQLRALTLPAIAILYMSFTLDSALQFWRGKGGLWKGRVQATGTRTV